MNPSSMPAEMAAAVRQCANDAREFGHNKDCLIAQEASAWIENAARALNEIEQRTRSKETRWSKDTMRAVWQIADRALKGDPQ